MLQLNIVQTVFKFENSIIGLFTCNLKYKIVGITVV